MKHKEIILGALGAALIFITTLLIKIPFAYGYFNLGDVLIFLFSSILCPPAAFLSGGIGSALADLSGGYAQYAFFTFFIKGMEGLLIAVLYQQLRIHPLCVYGSAALWMLIGYFLCDWFLYQQIGAAAASIIMNAIQGAASAVIATILYPRFIDVTKHFYHIKKSAADTDN